MNKLLFLTIYDWLLNLLKERGNYKQEDARLIRVMEVANNANAVMLFFSAMHYLHIAQKAPKESILLLYKPQNRGKYTLEII